MSAATIDRRLAGERAKRQLKGRRATKPGSLLRSQIPIRTWADWDDATPGFVEIDLVSHDGGNTIGPFAFTLTVTDVATGWTENRSVPSKEAKCVLGALESIANKMPFPILGVDSDNGAEFINVYLFLWCRNREITFTRARPTNKNDGCHVEQKNWAVVRTSCWLPPLRHRPRTVATQRNLAAAVPVDQLLLPTAEADVQGPGRRQGDQEIRHSDHPIPPRHQSPRHHRRPHSRSRPNPRFDQPRRHPAPDPGPDRTASQNDHEQVPTRHPGPSPQARTIT